MAVSKSQLKLLLVLVIFIAPVVLATLAYQFWRPEALSNYGELIEPAEFKPAGLSTASGEALDAAVLRGKWLLVLVQQGECDPACAQNLYLMRQVRLATGKEQQRLDRLLLSDRPLPEALAKEHAGLRQARYAAAGELGAYLSEAAAGGRIHLIDPLGRFVLRYPPRADGSKMLKDVQRLLKYSRIG
ncbi:MAG: hypothetical protein HY850_11425 [Betaproteobacteria bacterium]|nr:hypothetical protein [Betaproteobacteria bacterium]